MRCHHIGLVSIALFAAVALPGCAQKTEQAASQSTSDSLVASNPTEQTSGDITPQTTYQEPPKAETPPPVEAPKARSPKATPRTHTPTTTSHAQAPQEAPAVMVAAGTPVKIDVTSAITSESAQAGDTWTGTVKENLIVGDRVVIPAGSVVTGTIRASRPAKKGDRAMLLLGLSSVNVDGKDMMMTASTDSIIAGSTRARNLGAVAGGAAAGALIGRAVAGGAKGGVIGGLIGGALTGGAVASSKGYQVALKQGTELTFTTDGAIAFRR